MSNRMKLALAMAFVTALPVLAVNTKFTDFTPLTSSATGLPVDGPEEATPITLGNAKWSQRTVADRRTQNTLVPNSNSGNWDMITSNETGPDAGRYLFMPFETGTAGVQRIDTQNPHYEDRTVTIVAPGTMGFVSGDAFTGLYFDFKNPNRAFVNIQHPDSDVDRTIEITTQPNFQQGNK